MKNTIGDFWRMIWEQKSAAIVMLNEPEVERGKRRGEGKKRERRREGTKRLVHNI